MKPVRSRLLKTSLWLVVALLGLAACSPAATPPPATSVPSTSAPAVAPPAAPAVEPTKSVTEASLKFTQNATLGQFLTDADGHTLYMFTKDSADTTNCYDKCATFWPPMLTLGQPKLGAGVDATLVGATQRKDGTTQLTYNGWPLYYYTEDGAPGDVTGQAVQKVW